VKILVSGDSWTSGWPLEEKLGNREFAWPTLVSQALSGDLIDKSRAGSSNYRIYRKAFDEILIGDIDIAFVFLTSWTRFESGSGYGEKPGRIYQHFAMSDNTESEYLFKNFFNGYKNYTDMLRMIISLQKLAKLTGTKCYFLDTFDNNLLVNISLSEFKTILKYNPIVFDNSDDAYIENKFNKVKNLTSAIDQKLFISDKSYQSLINDCELVNGHPIATGHSKIAKIILDFLNHTSK
jgi:hypothetical protein